MIAYPTVSTKFEISYVLIWTVYVPMSLGIDLFLHSLGIDCRIGAHIVDHCICDYSDNLLDCFARYVVPLHSFGRLPDSSVSS